MIKSKGEDARAEICLYDTGSCFGGSDNKEGWFKVTKVNSLRTMAFGGVYKVRSKGVGCYAYAAKAVHVMIKI